MMSFENKNIETRDSSQRDEYPNKKNIHDDFLEEDYEFNHHKANLIHTALNSWKIFFGAAILAGPHSFTQSGLIGGIIGVAFGKIHSLRLSSNLGFIAAIINLTSVWMQIEVWKKINPSIDSYSELGKEVYGQTGKI